MKLADLPRRRVVNLGLVGDDFLSPSERYRLRNLEVCRARVRASKLKAKMARAGATSGQERKGNGKGQMG